MRNLIDKILNWYFSKNALPYWCIFLIDCGIVMASGIMTYWLFNSTQALYDNTFRVINTLICFVLLSVPGFRLFHTYSGYMRFAGFVARGVVCRFPYICRFPYLLVGHTVNVVLPCFREDFV